MSAQERLDWRRDGVSWPNTATSRFVTAGGISWHVQICGQGPTLLLVHGTAASTHSWRDVLPRLADQFTVVAMDLPGHAFTRIAHGRPNLTPQFMARALGTLLRELGVVAEIAVGHSAGAALLVEAQLAGVINPRIIIALNGALLPFRGIGRHLFPALARAMTLNPLMPDFFAWRARRGHAVRELIESMGSHIDDQGVALYRRLLADRAHVASALNMMASWNLESFVRALPGLETPLVLLAATNDRAVPPDDAWRVREILKSSVVHRLPGLGHLAHEEQPARLSELIADIGVRALRTA